jgi:hypothetical protein
MAGVVRGLPTGLGTRRPAMTCSKARVTGLAGCEDKDSAAGAPGPGSFGGSS